jgi:hypothetical protein
MVKMATKKAKIICESPLECTSRVGVGPTALLPLLHSPQSNGLLVETVVAYFTSPPRTNWYGTALPTDIGQIEPKQKGKILTFTDLEELYFILWHKAPIGDRVIPNEIYKRSPRQVEVGAKIFFPPINTWTTIEEW